MEIFVNDCSIEGQFHSPAEFRPTLIEMLKCRSCAEQFGRQFYISRKLPACNVCQGMAFYQAVLASHDLNIIRTVRTWTDHDGPFYDDDAIHSSSELYQVREQVVTDTGLAEAAARLFAEQQVAVVSFAPSSFTYTPLQVDWIHNDTVSQNCSIDNYWKQADLQHMLELCQAPVANWEELLRRAQTKFTLLTFLDDLEEGLTAYPFMPVVASRVMERLDVLNQLKGGFDELGRRTPHADHLLDIYFRRQNALFTDASDTEKNDPIFRSRMTFRMPDGETLECFWHGKINRPKYRIHFSYPIEKDSPLYIAYIGPKLTKQ